MAAEALLDRVEAVVESLARFPHRGAPRDEIEPGLRSLALRPYRNLLFYRVREDEIVLVRFLHGARALGDQDYPE